MSLKRYMKENMIFKSEHDYYNESFCNIVLDYISCYELTLNDIKFLNLNKYSMYDFIDYYREYDQNLIDYLENQIKVNNLDLY